MSERFRFDLYKKKGAEPVTKFVRSLTGIGGPLGSALRYQTDHLTWSIVVTDTKTGASARFVHSIFAITDADVKRSLGLLPAKKRNPDESLREALRRALHGTKADRKAAYRLAERHGGTEPPPGYSITRTKSGRYDIDGLRGRWSVPVHDSRRAAYEAAWDDFESYDAPNKPARNPVKKKSRKKARGSKKKHAKRSTRRKAKKAAAKKRRATKKRKPTKARKPSRKRKQTRRPKSAKKKRPAKARAKRRGRPLVGSHKGLTKKCRKCNRVHSAHAHDAHGHGAHRRVHGGIGASKRRTGMRMPLAKNCGPCAKNPHGYPHELPSRGRVFVRFGVHPRTGKRSVVIVHADGKTSWPVVRDGRIKFPRRVPKKFRREVEQAFRAIGLSRNPIGPVLGVVSGNPRRGKKRCGSPAHGTAALALRAFLAKQPEGKRIPHARLPREIQGNAVWLRAARLEAKRLGIPLARVVLEVRHTDLKGISPALAHVGRELAVEYRDARGKGWRHTAGDHGRGRKKTKAPDIAADPRTGAEIRLGGRGVRRKFTSRGLVG